MLHTEVPMSDDIRVATFNDQVPSTNAQVRDPLDREDEKEDDAPRLSVALSSSSSFSASSAYCELRRSVDAVVSLAPLASSQEKEAVQQDIDRLSQHFPPTDRPCCVCQDTLHESQSPQFPLPCCHERGWMCVKCGVQVVLSSTDKGRICCPRCRNVVIFQRALKEKGFEPLFSVLLPVVTETDPLDQDALADAINLNEPWPDEDTPANADAALEEGNAEEDDENYVMNDASSSAASSSSVGSETMEEDEALHLQNRSVLTSSDATTPSREEFLLALPQHVSKCDGHAEDVTSQSGSAVGSDPPALGSERDAFIDENQSSATWTTEEQCIQGVQRNWSRALRAQSQNLFWRSHVGRGLHRWVQLRQQLYGRERKGKWQRILSRRLGHDEQWMRDHMAWADAVAAFPSLIYLPHVVPHPVNWELLTWCLRRGRLLRVLESLRARQQ